MSARTATEMATGSEAKKRILFVDDDKETGIMMTALLETYGYEAIIVNSASEALDRARARGFDLCILDYWIPDGDGIELCQRIRSFDRVTPIMFYSGAAYEADIQEGLKAGAQAYLVKPDFENLQTMIDRLIN